MRSKTLLSASMPLKPLNQSIGQLLVSRWWFNKRWRWPADMVPALIATSGLRTVENDMLLAASCQVGQVCNRLGVSAAPRRVRSVAGVQFRRPRQHLCGSLAIQLGR